MNRGLAIALLLLAPVAIGVLPATAGAQEDPVTAEDEAQARAHFATAEAYYKSGDYAAAASEYLAAYDKKPLPALLLNAAQAYRLLGDAASALTYYREFVKLAPDHEFADDARGYIATLEATVSTETTPAPEPVEPAPEEPPAEAQTVVEPRPTPAPAPIIVEPATNHTLAIAGIASAGAGALLWGAGIYFAFKTEDLENQVEAHNASEINKIDCSARKPIDPEGLCDAGKSAQAATWISLGIGTAAVATGAVLYYLGTRDPEAPAAGIAVTPRASASSWGLSLSGTF